MFGVRVHGNMDFGKRFTNTHVNKKMEHQAGSAPGLNRFCRSAHNYSATGAINRCGYQSASTN
jgi:hypothetical protein